jgi:hypothetical protein
MANLAVGFDTRTVHLINGVACAFWAVVVGEAILKGRITFGKFAPKILRATSPLAYWSFVGVFLAVVLWTGTAAIVQKGVVYDCGRLPQADKISLPGGFPPFLCRRPSLPSSTFPSSPAGTIRTN